MRQKIIMLVVGCLIGAFAMSVLPVQAHHADAFRKLKNRVSVLEDRAQHLDKKGIYRWSIGGHQVMFQTTTCAANTAATWRPHTSASGWVVLKC